MANEILEALVVDVEKIAEVAKAIAVGELIMSRFCGQDQLARPHVELFDYPGIKLNIQSSMISLAEVAVGTELALMRTAGDAIEFVVIGKVHRPQTLVLDRVISATNLQGGHGDQEVFGQNPSPNQQNLIPLSLDGETRLIEAKEELVLRCGEASITLSKNGKIAIRGKYILNRATGVNRILGGSVQVN